MPQTGTEKSYLGKKEEKEHLYWCAKNDLTDGHGSASGFLFNVGKKK